VFRWIWVLLAILAVPTRATHLVSDPYPAGPLQPAQFTLICTTGPNPQIDFPSSINAQGRYFVNLDPLLRPALRRSITVRAHAATRTSGRRLRRRARFR
jgi:hypothetical protein